jgi:RHS repeat-associated protein
MQRYMNIELDPADDFEPIETVWTDYDGDRVYGDYEVVNSALVDVKSFEPGIGFVDDPTGTPAPGYYHGDMLGTTRRTTNASAAQVDNAAYTAFGEFLGGSADRRYGFAGAWQYQSHPGTGFPYLHVGHRYYDPAIGRFLQRDPIGIGGGFNVYAYVFSHPTIGVDPAGLWDWFEAVKWGAAGVVGGVVIIGLAPAITSGVIVGACAVAVSSTVAGGLEQSDIDRIIASMRQTFRGPSGGDWSTPDPVPPTCFTGSTLVETPMGGIPIDQLVVGDCVLSSDPNTGCANEATVMCVFRGLARTIVDIDLDGDHLSCTGEHPLFVVGSGWKRADIILPGEALLDIRGGPVCAVDVVVRRYRRAVPVYTLQVGDDATFYVGARRVLAHNKDVGY